MTSGVLLVREKTLYMAAAASASYFPLLFMETYGYFTPIPPARPGVGLLSEAIDALELGEVPLDECEEGLRPACGADTRRRTARSPSQSVSNTRAGRKPRGFTVRTVE